MDRKEVSKEFSSILERITDGFLFLDRNWRYTYINKRGAEIVGMQVEDLLGGCVWDKFPYAKNSDFGTFFHKAMETMEPQHFDEYYPEPLNMWLEVHCYPSEEGLAVHYRDVSDRKEMEEKNRRLSARFEMAQRAAGVGVWDWNVKTGHIEWTLEMFKLFGLDPNQTVASFDAWNAVLYPEDKNTASYKLDEALKNQSYLDNEYRIVRPDGQIVWINALGHGEYDENKQPTRMLGICMDITDRKKAELALQKERARLQLILDSLPVAVAVADETGSLRIVNRRTHEIWAGTSDDITQYNEYIGYLPGTDVRLKPEDWPISRALRQGATILHEEIDVQRQDGSRGTVLASAMPMKDERCKVNGALVAYMDISEMKKLERNLARSNVDLQQFAYVASHDLQEPLRTINNYLELLEKRYKNRLDAKAHEYIDYALQSGLRMHLLINDLLEYSRIDAVSMEYGPVDMNEVVSKSLGILNLQIKENDAEIEVEILPTIEADESQMILLMQNLIGNAIKFRGPERPMIQITASVGPRIITFAVKDNGIGIDMQYADRIFQMFHRLNTRSKYPGTGVGLAISKKIVDNHGGSIWVESQEGSGSTFKFTIPVSGNSNGRSEANSLKTDSNCNA